MVGSSILSELFGNIIQTKFVKEVFHSVVLMPTPEGGIFRKPMAPVNGRYDHVGVEDTKGFHCYCRQIGAIEVEKIDKIGACKRGLHYTTIAHRLVFFNNQEKRSHEDITSKLIKATINTTHLRLQRVYTIAEDILKLEAPSGHFTFKEKTYYVAIDFFVLLKLQTDNCDTEIGCEAFPNPFRL